MDALGPDTVRRLARLARLALTDDECERYGRELARVLDAFEVLARADLPPPDATVDARGDLAGEVSAEGRGFRADVVQDVLATATFLAAAPEREGNFVRVPAILGGAP